MTKIQNKSLLQQGIAGDLEYGSSQGSVTHAVVFVGMVQCVWEDQSCNPENDQIIFRPERSY